MKTKVYIFRVLALLLMTALLVIGVAKTAPAIINGQFDDDLHPYVGAVNNGVVACSGALISQTVFVTAGHCFYQWGNGVEVEVTFDSVTDGPGPWVEEIYSGTWHHHPEFCLGCAPGLPGFDTHDVGVVVLDEEVSLSKYAELPQLGLVDTLPMRTEVTVVGYGAQDISVGGGQPFFIYLYDRYFAVTELIASRHKHSHEFVKLTANPAQGKGADCFGDSGGPNLLGETDVILSVTSYGANMLCRGVGYSYRIDTQSALDFIESFLEP